MGAGRPGPLAAALAAFVLTAFPLASLAQGQGLALPEAPPAVRTPDARAPDARNPDARNPDARNPDAPAPEERPQLVAARLPGQGELALQLAAGKPFSSLTVEYAIFPALAVGLAYELATTGFSRAGARLRVRALRLGSAELELRLALGAVLPGPGTGYGARAIARTGDGELGLQLSYALLPALAVFGDGGVLGETDFGRPRTAAFLEAGGGAEWAVVGPLSLIGRYGGIKGARGSAQVFAAGLGAHF